jgi:acyl-CoA synthetase (AMP-forming)/AMP-acid ligase II
MISIEKDTAMTAAWTNITDPIFEHAARKPRAVAVMEGPTQLTFAEFASLIGKCTVYLKQLGIKSGHKVGVRITNSTDHLILSLALLRIGAVKFELSPASAPTELEAITRKFNLETLFLEPPMKLYRGARSVVVDLSWRAGIEALEGDVRHDDKTGEPYFINLTSGSTGPNKGIIVHHRQMIDRFLQYDAALTGTGLISSANPGTFLMMGNLSFAGFHAFMLYQVMSGAPTAVVPEFARFYDIVRHVNYYDDVVSMILPAMCEVFLSCSQKGVMLFPKVRAMVAGGIPLAGDTKKAMLAKVTPHFYEVYGASGTGWISLLRPEDMGRRSDGVGTPLPGMEVEILDAGGEPVGKNKIGHVRCRSSSTSENYLLAEDRSAGAEGFRDGWYYPGDLGQLDGSGFLTLKGRISDVIVRNGKEIYPAEVEAVIATHSSVKAAAVVGLPGPDGAAQVVALVVAKDQPDHHEVAAHCMAKLPLDMRPATIVYTDELPHTPAGKVNRPKVRELVLKAIQRSPAKRS